MRLRVDLVALYIWRRRNEPAPTMDTTKTRETDSASGESEYDGRA